MKTNFREIKFNLIGLISFGLSSIIGCTTANHRQNDIPKPPQNLNASTNDTQTTHLSPAPNKRSPSGSISSAESTNSYVPFTRVEEQKSSGGVVTEIKVNNRGDVPDYYLYPNQRQDLNINNPQKGISTPTWQFNW